MSAGRAAPPRGLWPGPEWSESWEHRSAQQTRRSKRMQAASLSWRWLAQICGASSSDRELTISGLWCFRKSTEDARMDLCRTRDAAQLQEDRENAQCSKSIASGTNAKTQTGQLPWPLPLQNGQLRDKGPATLQLAQEPFSSIRQNLTAQPPAHRESLCTGDSVRREFQTLLSHG